MGVSLARRRGRYLLVAGVLVLVYLTAVPALWFARGWSDQGPLSFNAPALRTSLPGLGSLGKVTSVCSVTSALISRGSYRYLKIVGGEIRGTPYYACYGVKADGTVWGAAVLRACLETFLVG
jgi:hypothetical protein